MLVRNVDTGVVQELRYDVAMRLVERGLYEHINAKEHTKAKPKAAPKPRSPKTKKQS
jgi:hypothetical protein